MAEFEVVVTFSLSCLLLPVVLSPICSAFQPLMSGSQGAAFWIVRDISKSREVTSDTVRGGISVYLLIGFVWSLFYGIAETLDSEAFSQQLISDSNSFLKALHFSFTTLTTLGYGDIVPVSEFALVLTNLEAIAGQMYSTIFIAILVGSYLSQQNRKDMQAKVGDRNL